MEIWNVHLTNSEVLKIKSKKKDLLKSEKKYLSAVSIENDNEKEILLNRNAIVWLSKEEKQAEKED
ncbi:MAG: hypothetical protein AB1695_01310 [Stygiobacter sp.]|jgi:hypothetical protein|uniref:Uncharacterized protein n=1 Tax=Stygiobacter electus TaxID=3032292 RepID=A0AAE3TDV9_9BACT|nr:hypothetical protein [Stygiobacter electus]MDF1612916.1 hypothetical protein [Stygiobacter electus]